MANEEAAVADGTAEVAAAKSSGGLVKAIGITVGLFLMMLTTQLVGPILGCSLLHSLTPNCPEPEPEVAEEGKAEAKPQLPPIYLAMDPPLVVSLQDNGAIRFLQVSMDFMARDEKIIEGIKTHMPVIRNNLLMMLGAQSVTTLTDRDAKEALRKQALAEVQAILKKNAGEAGVEDLYFTSFVVQ